jgi:hypothetical protein
MSADRRCFYRWGVLVSYAHSDDPTPFLAGRYLGAESREIADASIEKATFATRAEARGRARRIRSSGPTWRITATPVRVVVTVNRAQMDGEP